nr:MAG TPA: hypothetical protein [Caudoviricetes sp.]
MHNICPLDRGQCAFRCFYFSLINKKNVFTK